MATHKITSKQLNNEIWQPVQGFEECYEVSNRGRIKRIKNRSDAVQSIRIEHILNPSLAGHGYQSVTLCINNKPVRRNVHRLVAQSFLPPPLEHQTCVNHKDGNKLNNIVDNLEWCSYKENESHKINVLQKHSKGENHYGSKLTDKDIPIIRQLLTEGELSLRTIGDRFGVHPVTIWGIKHNHNWTHI